MEKEKKKGGGTQAIAIIIEVLLLASLNFVLYEAIPEYISGWYKFYLYAFLNTAVFLTHISIFKRSTRVVLLLILYVIVYVLSSFLIEVTRIKDGVWVSYSRRNLFNIQLSLERYAADHDGHYPSSIVGGQFSDKSSKLESLLYGYIEAYPRNESARSEMSDLFESDYFKGYLAVREKCPWLIGSYYYWTFPKDLATLSAQYSDPYRGPEGLLRFGKYGTLMGNVGADHRIDAAKSGYPFWERRKGSRDTLTTGLQGQFYYKAMYKPGSKQPDGYILMVFGSFASEGLDAFRTVPGGHELDGRLPDGSGVGMGVPVIPELGIEGDGKPDGVFGVLRRGWPWGIEFERGVWTYK